MALYATGFSEYACQLFGHGSSASPLGKTISIGVIILVVLINILGSKQVARAQTAIIAFELVILALFIILGLFQVHSLATWTQAPTTSPIGIFSAAGLLYVTYEGFGVVTNTAGNLQHPRRGLPIALFASLGIVMVVYIIVSIVMMMKIGAATAIANQGHVLATAGQAIFGTGGRLAIIVAALVATASAVNATMFGDKNLALRISKLDEIPPQFGVMTKLGGTWGLFITSMITCLFVVIFPLASVGQMASLAFLLVYAMVNIGHVRVTAATGAKRWALITAAGLNLALFALLFAQTILDGETLTWLAVILLVVISVGVEYLWRKRNHQNVRWLGPRLGAQPATKSPQR